MKTVLIVEDDDQLRKGYAEFLCDNYKILTACDGKEALEVFKKEQIDFVVLDLIMPDVSGMETLKKLKEVNNNVKVLILTALLGYSIEQSLMALGATAFLRKPVMGRELCAEIDRMDGK